MPTLSRLKYHTFLYHSFAVSTDSEPFNYDRGFFSVKYKDTLVILRLLSLDFHA